MTGAIIPPKPCCRAGNFENHNTAATDSRPWRQHAVPLGLINPNDGPHTGSSGFDTDCTALGDTETAIGDASGGESLAALVDALSAIRWLS